MSFVVNTNFRHNGKRYEAGQKLEGNTKDIEYFLQKGFVSELKKPAELLKEKPVKKPAKKKAVKKEE